MNINLLNSLIYKTMRKNLLSKLMLLLTMMVVGVGSAWGEEKTITIGINPSNSSSSTYLTSVQTFTIEGVDFKMNNYNPSSGQIRGNQSSVSSNFYLYNTTEIPGTIKSVEFTGIDGTLVDEKTYIRTNETAFVQSQLDAKGTNPSSGKWENLDNSYFCITMAKGGTSGTTKISGIIITYETSTITLLSNDLTLSATELALVLGETSTAQLTNSGQADGTITWTSSNENVATVDAQGNVSAVEIGTATITATQAASSTYKGGTAECAVTVTDSRYSVSSLVFEAACGGTGTADDGNTWTITSDGSESNFDNERGIHYGTGSANVQWLQLQSSSNNGTIKKVVVNAYDAQAASTISVTVGGTDLTCIGSSSVLAASSDFVFTGSAKGEITVLIDRGSSMTKAIYVKKVDVYYEPSALLNPELSYETTSFNVSIGDDFETPELTNPNNLVVTYSSDNSQVASVDASTGSVTIGTIAGTATITATFGGNDTYDAGTAHYTITVIDPNVSGGKNNPYTVAQAIAAIDAGEGVTGVYVTGIVSKIVTAYNSEYGNISYNISVDGSENSDQLEAFRGFSFGGEAFTSEDDIKVGDVVVIYGDLTKYGSTYEFAAGNYLISLVHSLAAPSISGDESFVSSTTVTITASDGATIYYTLDGTDPTVNSTEYTEPFTLEATTTVKAIAVSDGVTSAVAEQTFTKIEAENGLFELVTDASQLVAGKEYILVATSQNVAMGAQGNNIRSYATINIIDGKIAPSNDIAILTLGGTTDAWTFLASDNDQYLALTANENKLYASDDATLSTSQWVITEDFQVKSTAQDDERYIRYNSGSPRFACYKSGQVEAFLYVKVEEESQTLEGDLNSDGKVDGEDVAEMVFQILQGDSTYTLSDVTKLVNAIVNANANSGTED